MKETNYKPNREPADQETQFFFLVARTDRYSQKEKYK